MTDEELYALKDRASARFLSLPGVTAVGLGGRTRGGRPTGEVTIKVLVARKRPLAELPPEERLPAEFEGVGVDVGEGGPFRLVAEPVEGDDPGGSPAVPGTEEDDEKKRPLIGGTRIIPKLDGATGGTLGCFVQHQTNDSLFYALTAFHVLTAHHHAVHPDLTTRVGQPSPKESRTKCCSHLFGTFAGGKFDLGAGQPADHKIDRGLVQLDPGMEFVPEIRQIGAVQDVAAPPTPAEAAARTFIVRKRGQTTRLTTGVVTIVEANAVIPDGTMPHTMVVEPRPNADVPAGTQIFFGTSGDSGSAVVVQNDVRDAAGALVRREKRVVGLLFAQGDLEDAQHRPIPLVTGLVTPIGVVLDTLRDVDQIPVKLVTAQTEGEKRTVPDQHPVARPHVAEPPPELAGIWSTGLPPYEEVLPRIGRDLEATSAGRALVDLWLGHQDELLGLVDRRRRVTIAWHRGGGPALMQTLFRMAGDPGFRMPATLNGTPPLTRIDHIAAVLRAHASAELRAALDRARAVLPDPAQLTYDQWIAALAER